MGGEPIFDRLAAAGHRVAQRSAVRRDRWAAIARGARLPVLAGTAALALVAWWLSGWDPWPWVGGARHVAMVKYDDELRPFFRRVAARLGQPRQFAIATRCRSGLGDPLRHWVNSLRFYCEPTRTEFWQRLHESGLREQPFPEIRDFK